MNPFVDIHCHLLPGIDDGSKSWAESLTMAQMAVADGFETIICTPHQLGNFRHNDGDSIRQHTQEMTRFLAKHKVPLRVMPGGDVRIEDDMFDLLRAGKVLTLGDQGRHVLLELPHELYFPLEGVLDGLESMGMVGILSHPERNQGLLRRPELLAPLVERGCLMQITAGSLMGTFSSASQELAESMVRQRLVHFVSTDAHGPKSRRPLLARAYHRVADIDNAEVADLLCCKNPTAVANGVDAEMLEPQLEGRGIFDWLGWRKAA
jgi:protein-tyrosine phosphatase